ncbi:MAG TPA: META domain-containing protein [Xanthobacteraceae bacterium]|nr:META domain-containing protein [Xanthobacteraceae bacterium]
MPYRPLPNVRRAAALIALVAALAPGSRAAESRFPANEELLLDAPPMRGSKQVPMLVIGNNGAVTIDLWCNSVQGQIVVVAETVAILMGPKTERACPPERARGDEEMISWLSQVTTWRREGDNIVLIGPRTLRFVKATN